MSLMGTLAKVAVGIAVAKGVKSLTTGGGSPRSTGGGGMLGDLLKNVAGGQQQAGGRQQGGDILGDLLGGLAGGTAGRSSGPGASVGLDNIMEGLTRGGGNASGGLGDILGKLGGAGGAAGGLGGLLTNALENRGQVTQKTNQSEEEAAGLLIRAMLQAAKADGQIDEAEKQKLLGRLGDLDQNEVNFINAELNRGVDLDGLVRDTPRGMEQQVYMMSLMGIDLDSQQEAQYLHDLGGALGMDRNQVNQVHEMLGVQSLYG